MDRPAPVALVRPPGPSFPQAQSSHPDQQTLNFEKALYQHHLYCETLTRAGFCVVHLTPFSDLADSVFIEDNAIVLDNQAWLCHTRALSRKEEAARTGHDLERHIKVGALDPSVHLDGGDVLLTDTHIFVGLSSRSHESAIPALQSITQLPVVGVEVIEGLHLKSAATFLAPGKLLLDPSRIDTNAFREYDWIEVPVEESYAANALVRKNTVIMAEGFFGTQSRLEKAGWQVLTVPMSEFEKADGGITCLSLILHNTR